MKAFTFSEDQLSSVAAALVVDELGARFSRHVDTLTASGWSAATKLGDEGAELSAAEAAACLRRLFAFFGRLDRAPKTLAADSIGDWVKAIAAAIDERLTEFSFAAAADERRPFTHAADAIFADAASAANLLYGRRRVLSLVAPHGLIGFVLGVLAPNLLQAPTVDARKMTPDELNAALSFGDALIATPSLWRYILAQDILAPDNAMAVSFGEPMTVELSAKIRRAGFGAQREIYGSTEHGLIGWRDSPSEPFALFDQWARRGEDLRRATPSGEAVDVIPVDVIAWEGDRRFRLGGRRDGAVQIGAVNVFPDRIAQRIAEHPDVAACVISVSQDSAGGERLVALITLNTKLAPSESVARSIDMWCRSHLRPHERPRIYNYAAPRQR
ncbi:MAG TPA: hypothetical protein PKM48_02575 [Parvularculaceae bacterium]|nr:hypothetical protein [Parvularculaceae bacterium]HNS87321.1 hypothetical protein [Parvularculaceae bacterium]